MAFVINCGEQETEDNGISISMTIVAENSTSPDEIFIHIVDNLLGVSEFITDCEYDYAVVGIDYNKGDISEEEKRLFSNFNNFLEKKGNEKLLELFNRYVDCYAEEPLIEEGTFWYTFNLNNLGEASKMSDEDHAAFCQIFRERLK